jgi:hypothetical protein
MGSQIANCYPKPHREFNTGLSAKIWQGKDQIEPIGESRLSFSSNIFNEYPATIAAR